MILNEPEIYPYETSDFSDRDCIVIAPHLMTSLSVVGEVL